MNRRDFIKRSALLAATATVSATSSATTLETPENLQVDGDKKTPADSPLIDSAPMLENYAETSMGVVFSVTDLANGFVDVSENADMSDSRRVMCGGYRVTDLNEDVMRVRLTGLKPATKYYYKIGATRIRYAGYRDKSVEETEIDGNIYSFTTAGCKATAHFCVINDTHVRWKAFDRCIEKVADINPSCVIWNGDVNNSTDTIEDQKKIFLKPQIKRKDFGANTPYLFSPGNHDDRGRANWHFERVWMFRQPEERSSRDWDLGRNYAVRMGDIALIGLDTAEDKLDTNPRQMGMYLSQEYRVAQKAWLADALKAKEIASAPFIVAFCHIPLYDERPKANPGDIAPDDTDEKYTTTYALWQRTCANLWGPLLDKAGCQLLITAHQHVFRYDEPNKAHKWAQIVGGGPYLGEYTKNGVTTKAPHLFPTVIEGMVENKKLKIIVHNVATGEVQAEYTYNPRKV